MATDTNTEINKRLFTDFPNLFKNKDNPKISLMGFGVECDKGWNDLIYNLTKCISDYKKNNPKHVSESLEIVQIKEKFGGLRYYVEGGAETIHGMIWFAEKLSYTICEKCGKSGKLREDIGWIKTLCDEHYQKRLDEIKEMWRKRK